MYTCYPGSQWFFIHEKVILKGNCYLTVYYRKRSMNTVFRFAIETVHVFCRWIPQLIHLISESTLTLGFLFLNEFWFAWTWSVKISDDFKTQTDVSWWTSGDLWSTCKRDWSLVDLHFGRTKFSRKFKGYRFEFASLVSLEGLSSSRVDFIQNALCSLSGRLAFSYT